MACAWFPAHLGCDTADTGNTLRVYDVSTDAQLHSSSIYLGVGSMDDAAVCPFPSSSVEVFID